LPIELNIESKRELLHTLKECYDYDFTGYSEASLNRRILRFTERNSFKTFSDLKHELVNNKDLFEHFVMEITVNVTEMFRDPGFYYALTGHVFPSLHTYPFRRIWHAGCSTGEEVYSLAILLEEYNLSENTRTYATDINKEVLVKAAEGVYEHSPFREYSLQYKQSGGKYELNDYYINYNDTASVKLNNRLIKNVIFSTHNLVSDASINEFNLVICRNVLIYFDKNLQERVFKLFYDSLCIFGFLALGSKETLQFSKWMDKFEVVDKKEKIYRKIG
jgi:chemotaxis protein methyltransferase CheR